MVRVHISTMHAWLRGASGLASPIVATLNPRILTPGKRKYLHVLVWYQHLNIREELELDAYLLQVLLLFTPGTWSL
jgi:hypothetical protein